MASDESSTSEDVAGSDTSTTPRRGTRSRRAVRPGHPYAERSGEEIIERRVKPGGHTARPGFATVRITSSEHSQPWTRQIPAHHAVSTSTPNNFRPRAHSTHAEVTLVGRGGWSQQRHTTKSHGVAGCPELTGRRRANKFGAAVYAR
ncbi:hypothetical protein F441_05333 [Phytophthora nicotianae CJ01A1]|uniref:Uncharacterized protein n=1 Tax=Phytophthora nicotianae CJ01A1 TaxID=1317063 RepID=W2XGC6_PHYNI|nr:hypothetical protein F441_05333 [Phytophthora nicotianae CJ01A1]